MSDTDQRALWTSEEWRSHALNLEHQLAEFFWSRYESLARCHEEMKKHEFGDDYNSDFIRAHIEEELMLSAVYPLLYDKDYSRNQKERDKTLRKAKKKKEIALGETGSTRWLIAHLDYELYWLKQYAQSPESDMWNALDRLMAARGLYHSIHGDIHREYGVSETKKNAAGNRWKSSQDLKQLAIDWYKANGKNYPSKIKAAEAMNEKGIFPPSVTAEHIAYRWLQGISLD